MVCGLAGLDGWLDAAVRERMGADAEDRDFWSRVFGELVEAVADGVTVYATVAGETAGGDPIFWDAGASRFESDEDGAGLVEVPTTSELLLAAHPALRDAAEAAWEG